MASTPRDSAPGSRLLQRRLAVAAGLVAALPLLVLTYVVGGVAVLGPERQPHEIAWAVGLIGATALVAGMAGVALWRVARAVSAPRPASAAMDGRGPFGVPAPGDAVPAPPAGLEVDTLMESFSQMLGTVERQATEINSYARRLENAYKEVETSSAKLKEFSFKDEVTGLYNRRFFSIRLEEEVSRYRRFNHPVSVVLLDLDGFKAVNDELGHGAGDETLRGVADILLKNSRGINVICRYGGDEFAVLLVETSKAGARLYADRIRYVLPTHDFSHGRPITASFGIASLPEDVSPVADDLFRAADEALYAAKRAGKNRVSVYEDVPGARPKERTKLD